MSKVPCQFKKWILSRGYHGGVQMMKQKRHLTNRPSTTPRTILKKVLDSYVFIYYSRQNMVSGQQVEFIILPLFSHPHPCLGSEIILYLLKLWILINVCKLKPSNGIYHHFHPLSDPNRGWGWLIRVGWWTLPTGLRPCSGRNSRWSSRNLKPFENDSRGPRGPI